MSKKKKTSVTLVTPEFRLSFPEIFEAKSFQGNPPKFSLQALWPKETDLKELKAACAKVAADNFGPNWQKMNLKSPFRDGDTYLNQMGEPYASHLGHIFASMSATTKFPPKIVDQKKNEVLDHSKVYGGCYCRAVVNVYSYDTLGNKGVAFGFNVLQKLRDGEPFGASGKSLSLLDEVESSDNDDWADEGGF